MPLSSASTHPALIHPGEILLSEFMEPFGLTAYRLAKDLAVPAPRVGDIVRGKRAISADTALRLGIYFGLPAQFWMNLQNEFDLRLAAQSPALKQVSPRAA
jgi:addiction module HigA family antidote